MFSRSAATLGIDSSSTNSRTIACRWVDRNASTSSRCCADSASHEETREHAETNQAFHVRIIGFYQGDPESTRRLPIKGVTFFCYHPSRNPMKSKCLAALDVSRPRRAAVHCSVSRDRRSHRGGAGAEAGRRRHPRRPTDSRFSISTSCPMPTSASTRSIWSACRWGPGASATRFSVGRPCRT